MISFFKVMKYFIKYYEEYQIFSRLESKRFCLFIINMKTGFSLFFYKLYAKSTLT